MKKILKIVASEPLIHFLLLGFLLFIYFKFTQIDTKIQNKTVINISSSEIDSITAENKDNRQVFIDKKFYEKLLVDEAYSLDLVMQDDLIIQRLLKQMQFIMLNSNKIVEPTENQLLEYYNKNIKDYSNVQTLSFVHIYFLNRADKRIDEIDSFLRVEDINISQTFSFGDKFNGSSSLKNISYLEIKKSYGNYFASKIVTLKSGVWHKSIFSKYGTHFVYILDKNVSTPYSFDDVQGRVYDDYKREQRDKALKKAYQMIKAQYILKVQL